jgi:LacI family transcriptional regulator
MNVPSVTNNNFTGGREAVLHLLEQGYERIAHFAGPLHINIYNERFRGYRDGLSEHDIPYDKHLVFEDVLTREVAYERTLQIFSEKKPPDAIFAASDFGALGALAALRKLGIKVPGEVGVVGFANEPLTQLMVPGITTFDQHSEEMGKVAARLLIDALAQSETQTIHKTTIVKPTLIVRESSLRTKIITHES